MNYHNYNISNWEDRQQTPAEDEVNGFLKHYDWSNNPNPDVLHIGIGCNRFYKELQKHIEINYTGITYTIFEYEKVLPLQSCTYNPMLINKYNPILGNILKSYNCIVDVNITSYASYDLEALNYFNLLLHTLKVGGILCTHQMGLDYMRRGNIKQMLKDLKLNDRFSYHNTGGVVIIEKL